MEETIDALRERGNEYYRSKNYVEAIGCYDEIMKLDTEIDRPKILGNRSAAYIALGKWKMAEEDARRALELDFGNEKFMFRLASSLLEQAEDTKKIESLKVCDDALLPTLLTGAHTLSKELGCTQGFRPGATTAFRNVAPGATVGGECWTTLGRHVMCHAKAKGFKRACICIMDAMGMGL